MGKNLSASMGYRDQISKNQELLITFRSSERVINGKIEYNNIERDLE